MATRLVIEGNMVYEIDEECERQFRMNGRGRNQKKMKEEPMTEDSEKEIPKEKNTITVWEDNSRK